MINFFIILIFFLSCSHQKMEKTSYRKAKAEIKRIVEDKTSVILNKRKIHSNENKINLTETQKQDRRKKHKQYKYKHRGSSKKGTHSDLIVEPPKASILKGSLPNLEKEFLKKVKIPFRYKYSVSLMGVPMGDLERRSVQEVKGEMVFEGNLKNRSIYKYLYSIDDKLVTKISLKSLMPEVVDMEKNENGVSSISVQKNIGSNVYFFEKTVKKNKESSKERKVTYLGHYFDPLLFLRLIEITDVVHLSKTPIPIIFRGKFYKMKIRNIKKIKKRIKGKYLWLQKISFDTYKNNRLKKDQRITITKTLGKRPRIFSLEGKMKVGLLYGQIIE